MSKPSGARLAATIIIALFSLSLFLPLCFLPLQYTREMTPVSNQVEPQQAHDEAIHNNGIDEKITATTTMAPFAQKLSKGFGLIRQVSSIVVCGCGEDDFGCHGNSMCLSS